MIDHIILGCKEIEEGIQFIYQKTSVMPQKGGRHPQWGTLNALLSLGQNSYLEVMAPIPGQATKYPFDSLPDFSTPKWLAWAARTEDILAVKTTLDSMNVKHSDIIPGARIKPDGQMLRWKLLFPENNYSGVFPFFIEWESKSLHPALTSPIGLSLMTWHLGHPEFSKINACFIQLKVGLHCTESVQPKLQGLFQVGQKNAVWI